MASGFIGGPEMLPRVALFLVLPILLAGSVQSECISPRDARNHVGETKCVAGKVIRVTQRDNGLHYIQFCEQTLCEFNAVIFPGDLRHIGDVRQLEGKFVEIHGDVREYDGGTEIIVSESRQLRGEGASIPPLPKSYDVEKKGHYSAGTFSHPKTYSTSKKRQTAKLPIKIPEDASQ